MGAVPAEIQVSLSKKQMTNVVMVSTACRNHQARRKGWILEVAVELPRRRPGRLEKVRLLTPRTPEKVAVAGLVEFAHAMNGSASTSVCLGSAQ